MFYSFTVIARLQIVWFLAGWFRLIWLFEENWPRSVSLKFTSWRWVNQLSFCAAFLTHQGWDWVRQYSPCAQLWLGESFLQFYRIPAGCHNHRVHFTYLLYTRLHTCTFWVIPNQGVLKMLNFVGPAKHLKL